VSLYFSAHEKKMYSWIVIAKGKSQLSCPRLCLNTMMIIFSIPNTFSYGKVEIKQIWFADF
jgi:hypothetical protein